jgi:hydrogenase maturation protease
VNYERGRYRLKDEWESRLHELLDDERTPLHLVGIGSPLRSDDSVGLQIIAGLLKNLGKRPREHVFLHQSTPTSEHVLSSLDCTKTRVLVFDAVQANGKPGDVIFADLGQSKFGYFATHNVPLRLLPNVAANPSNVYVAGIEPQSLEVGEVLSEAVRTSADRISEIVQSSLGGVVHGPD